MTKTNARTSKNKSSQELKAAHKHCSHNRAAVTGSALCGCFYCLEIFPAAQVQEYVSSEDAVCPKCGIDSVIADASGYPLSLEWLTAMRDYWFDSSD